MSEPSPQLSPSTLPPLVAFARWVAVGSLIALIVLSLAWELWLAPIRPGGSIVMAALKALPLCIPLVGFLKLRMYTYRWVSLFVWLYFADGAVRASVNTGTAQVLALVEILLCLLLFAACVLHVRSRLRKSVA